jgi:hypothetical protein
MKRRPRPTRIAALTFFRSTYLLPIPSRVPLTAVCELALRPEHGDFGMPFTFSLGAERAVLLSRKVLIAPPPSLAVVINAVIEGDFVT